MPPKITQPKVIHITTIDLSLRYLLLNQLRHIAAAGYEVVAISSNGPHVPVIKAADIRHIPVTMTRRFTPFADLISLISLWRVLRRERPTIVHTHNPKPGLLGQLAARLARVPIVVNTLHGFYFHAETPAHTRRFYILTEKIAARCSDLILSQNREDMQTAVSEKICPPDRIKFLGNGIDIERFDPAKIDAAALAQCRAAFGLDPERPVIGFVGRLVREKGILDLLKAAQQIHLARPDVQFLFVGPHDSEKADAITPASAADFGLQHVAIFTGSRHDMPEMYALMDIFTLPSHREGFPRAPMEASAMGVPCVVTNIRGCREAVLEGRNGRLVPPRDPAALAQTLLHLLHNPDLRHKLGAAGRQLAAEQFDERRVFQTVTAAYSRLLAQKQVKVS